MSTMSEITDADSPLKMLEMALKQETGGSGSKRDADFREAFPLIEQYLAGKFRQKVLLDKFNTAYGHKLHPPGFRKMLVAERKRRSMDGEDVTCQACGQRLHAVGETVGDDGSQNE